MKLNIKSLLLAGLLMAITFQAFSQGLALYTVRNDMGKDPVATLQLVADAGYKYFEAAGYSNGKFYGMEPKVFKETVEKMGLTPMSTHMAMVTLDNADQLISDTRDAGFKYFVIPIPPMGHFKFDRETGMAMSEDLDELLNIFNTIGKKCADAGIQLLYHNHNFEFQENSKGVIPIEYFLENSDPEILNFQMDLYWVTNAEKDPVAYFEKYPGRFKSWHVKDMDTQGRFAPVGTGTIDFERILAEKDSSGMEFYMVEQDATYDGQKPLEVIKISMEGLEKYGFK